MKTLTLITAITLAVLTATAQWEWQNPLPQGNSLNDVSFIDQDNGWAVGKLGTIIRTNDGGVNFEALQSNVQVDLQAVEFFSSQYGFAVGDQGTIIETNNGGKDWTQLETGITTNLNDICIVLPNRMWVVGNEGVILYSQDGGNSWDVQHEDSTINIFCVYFLDKNTGWAAGGNESHESVVLYTTDGGNYWAELTGNVSARFYEIHFTNQFNGWAIGSGDVYMSVDGGATWTEQLQEPPGLSPINYSDVYFTDADHGWVVGVTTGYVPLQLSIIKHTSDGGQTWVSQDANSWKGLSSVYFTGIEHGCAIGINGNIVTTWSGGNYWDQTCGSYQNPILLDVFFTDNNHGWVAGGFSYPFISNLSHTADGGKSWNQCDVPFHYYKAIHFVNQLEGWVAGGGFYSSEFSNNVVIHTMDGGQTWETQYEGEGSHDFYTFKDIYFTDTDHGWVVGGSLNVHPPRNPIFLQTSDGGNTWEDIVYITENCLNAITFSDDMNGWVVGHETILKTVDGGESWTEIWEGEHSLKDVFFIDNSHGWVIGDSIFEYGTPDVVMYTTDGGDTWGKEFLDYELNKIYFTDVNTGYITVGNGILLYTIDGGISWQEEFINTEGSLHGIYFLDDQNGWVVGENASILHTTSGGLVGWNENEKNDKEFYKVKAYPNPFTATTTIEYELQQPSTVQITIYNHLGKQVAGFAFGHKGQGRHTFSWQPRSLQAEVYYCVLRTDNGIKTTKLIKMK